MADVYELAELAFSHAQDVPELDVIPLFEQLEDLENCVTVLDGMLQLPAVQRRLAQTGGAWSHAGLLGLFEGRRRLRRSPCIPRSASPAGRERGIDVVLMHGRGGAVGASG
ncbi:MAG: phosphoenolpyruvate carboxylase [Eggerthella lenta]